MIEIIISVGGTVAVGMIVVSIISGLLFCICLALSFRANDIKFLGQGFFAALFFGGLLVGFLAFLIFIVSEAA